MDYHQIQKFRNKGFSKSFLFVGGVFTLLLWFLMLEAGGARENQIKGIRFAPHPTFSRVIFEMKRDFAYHLTPDFKGQKLILKVSDTRIPEEFVKRKITDARIEGISLRESKKTGELIITVFLRYAKNNVYHLSLEGPPRLVLDIQKKNGPAKHSARSVLKRKSFPELEEKSEPAVLEDEAPREKAKTVPEAKPANKEIIAAKEELSPEEVERQNQILKEVEKKNAGKDLYIEGLRLYQQTQYAEAYLRFRKFTEKFPESPYSHNAYYLMGDCQFNLLNEKKPDYAAAVHDFRVALRKFPRSPHRDAALFKLGKMYFSQNLYVEAMASFDEILEDYGKGRYGLQAKLMKANMFYARQNFERAYDLYKEVILISPFSPEAKTASFSIGDYLFDAKNYDHALKVYIEASKRWPTYPKIHPHIIFNMGKLFYEKKDFDKARRQFYILVNLYPNFDLSGQAMTLIGDSFLFEGKQISGMKVFSETAARRPETPEANYGRLRIAEIGVENAAYAPKKEIFEMYDAYYNPLETYREISRQYPDDPKSVADALLHEGVALSKKKRFFQAILIFREIHEKFPETSQSKEVKRMIQNSFYDMVNTYYGQEGFLPLLAAFHENLDPYLKDMEDLKTLFLIAESYRKIGLFEPAVRYYQRIKEIDKKDEYRDAMIIKLSSIHKEMGNYEEAERALTRFLNEFTKSKNIFEAISGLGDIMFDQERYEEAANYYSNYVKRFPKIKNISSIYARLGKALKESGKYSEAIKAFKNSVKRFKVVDPTVPVPRFYTDNFYEIGDSYYLSGEYEKAVDAYQEAVDKFEGNQRNVYAKYFIGESYARLNEETSAESQLKNVAESFQGEIWSRAAELSTNALKWEKEYQEFL